MNRVWNAATALARKRLGARPACGTRECGPAAVKIGRVAQTKKTIRQFPVTRQSFKNRIFPRIRTLLRLRQPRSGIWAIRPSTMAGVVRNVGEKANKPKSAAFCRKPLHIMGGKFGKCREKARREGRLVRLFPAFSGKYAFFRLLVGEA